MAFIELGEVDEATCFGYNAFGNTFGPSIPVKDIGIVLKAIEEVKAEQKASKMPANILSLTVSSEYVRVNESVTLICTLDGTNATVTWSHFVSGSSKLLFDEAEPTLEIENARLEDSGVYFCSSGEQNRSAEIYVYEEPIIKNELVEVQLNDSLKADLDCSVQQGTDLTFTWIASDQIKEGQK